MVFAGLLDLKGAQEWVVTTKLGSADTRPGTQQPLSKTCRLYAGEMMFSTFVLSAAFYGVFSVNKWSFSIFLVLQGTATPPVSCCVTEASTLQPKHAILF